jgi:hypothetical protein
VTLHILAEAEDEIESARRFLNNKSPEFGRRFIDELDITDSAVFSNNYEVTRY